MDDLHQLRAEQGRILEMPGRAAWVKLKRLRRTVTIFQGNAEALLGHLKRMDDLGYMLPTTSDPRAFEAFLDEVERHLHNYVAAAQSRVDHFRVFKREDMPEGFRDEYQRRIDTEFKAAPLHRFIIDLRHLMLHIRLPASTTTETWGPGNSWSFRVLLDSADLLGRWGGWSSEARQHIEASGKSVDLRATVVTYTEQVTTFDRWVAEGFIREHLEEIESYLEAEQQYLARLRQLGLYNDPRASAFSRYVRFIGS
jgi:hypothetical protein